MKSLKEITPNKTEKINGTMTIERTTADKVDEAGVKKSFIPFQIHKCWVNVIEIKHI